MSTRGVKLLGMKRVLPVFVLALVAGAVVGFASAAQAAGPKLAATTTYHLDLSNCDGGVNATVAAGGDYYVAFKDEGVYLCTFDAGCASGGQWNPANLTVRMAFSDNEPLSCRSDGMTGDVSMTLITPGT